jgi:acetylornithine deacetylase
MDVIGLTRALVDIESITENEEAVGEYLFGLLSRMAEGTGGTVQKLEVAPGRCNVLAWWGDAPTVTLSTHMDTVPPFFPSREDDTDVWGRGACDTKGIIASMIKASERLIATNTRNHALLFVVGEERNSAGAYAAAQDPRGCRFIINGEPTENRLALGSKGCLRYEAIASGRMAHSAYPELGDSAIHKLIPILERLLQTDLPVDELLGPATMNIGTITGGRATNVIADYAKAEIMIRLIDTGETTDDIVRKAAGDSIEMKEVLRIPAVRLGSLEGFETTVVKYTTDIPAFGTAWGQPFLIGPGTIHVAHTTEERVPKAQLHQAVELYETMVRRLLAQ